jgi:nitrogen fixation protein FixH
MATKPSRKSRAWIWPVGITIALAIHTGAMLLAVAVASRDKSFRVDPDYYRRGFDWDKKKAAIADSQKLGWNVWLTADAKNISVQLRDASGASIDNASVKATFFHNARAADTQSVELKSADSTSGHYTVPASLDRPGFYTVDLDITAGTQHYVDSKTIWINPQN